MDKMEFAAKAARYIAEKNEDGTFKPFTPIEDTATTFGDVARTFLRWVWGQ